MRRIPNNILVAYVPLAFYLWISYIWSILKAGLG